MDLIRSGLKLLAVAPHPDDVEFGLGGLLHRFGSSIVLKVLVLSDRSQTRGEQHNERDQRRALERLGQPPEAAVFLDQVPGFGPRLRPQTLASEENRATIRNLLIAVDREFQPDLVFVPAVSETMQDHQAVGEEACRILRGDFSILGYEVPRHNRGFAPDTFLRLSAENVEAKAEALACYGEFTNRYYFDPDALRSLARVRALDAGFLGFAEGFQAYRLFLG